MFISHNSDSFLRIVRYKLTIIKPKKSESELCDKFEITLLFCDEIKHKPHPTSYYFIQRFLSNHT